MVYYQFFGSLLDREAKALQEKGFNVDIICLRLSEKEKTLNVHDGLNVYGIQARPTAEKSVLAYMENLFLFFIKAFAMVTIFSFSRRYKIVHITTPPDFMVLTALVPKIFGAKLIMDIHDIGPELFVRKLGAEEDIRMFRILKFIEKISAMFVDHVITVTDIWKDKLVKRSVRSSKCSVLLNVPDDNLFKPLNKNNREQLDYFNLYYHGSLEEHFGVDTMLEAMPVIKQHISNVRLHIYGGKRGRLYDDFKKQIQDMKMQDYVFLHDAVPFHVLPEILKDADLGIVPTKNGYFSDEAISMKSMEYIFLHIPIVISQTMAHSHYYDKSMVKFFIPTDKNSLADAVIYLYENPHIRIENVINTEKFIKKYGWHAQSKKEYLDIIDKLVS
jgi:glycosyltransferase involved in cell wall biosynthesis